MKTVNCTKQGFIYKEDNPNKIRIENPNASFFSYVNSYDIPKETKGFYKINEGSYTGDVVQLLVLSADWLIVVSDKMLTLANEINTLSSGAYFTQVTLWGDSIDANNRNYTARDAARAEVKTHGGQARKNIQEIEYGNTTFFGITSPTDTNYSGSQNPSLASRLPISTGEHEFLAEKYEIRPTWFLYSYIKVPFSLKDGDQYTITLGNGDTATFTFSLNNSVSRAIKINQVGYLPDANIKRAYIGAYTYEHGPIDFSSTTSFEVVNMATGSIALSGTATLGAANPVFNPGTNDNLRYGEDVYVIDLSSLTTPGKYFIRVAGVGRSWPFRISDDVYSEIFYITARGLYHHRNGIPLLNKYTFWPRKKAKLGPYYYKCKHLVNMQPSAPSFGDNTTTYTGSEVLSQTYTTGIGSGFSITLAAGNISNGSLIDFQTEADYTTFSGGSGYAVNDYLHITNGATVKVTAESAGVVTGFKIGKASYGVFDVIGGSLDKGTPIAEVEGGYHDAADWDARLTHSLSGIELMYAFQTNSSAFIDGQLDIPESGNGIPDILSEVRYGLNLWRASQLGSGAISEHLESWTHLNIDSTIIPPGPGGANKGDYCFSTYTRWASLQYAAMAAQYARLIQPFDAGDSAIWQTSAINAYNYGINIANSLGNYIIPYTENRGAGPNSSEYLWVENESQLDHYKIWAKCQLYLLTGDITYITDTPHVNTLSAAAPDPFAWTWTHKDVSPWIYYSLIEAYNAGATALATEAGNWETFFLNTADTLEGYMTGDPYRCTWPATQDFFAAWGNTQMPNYNRALFIAHQISGLDKYKDAMILNMDYAFGCNPMGWSWTTGVGYVYPVMIQHTNSEDDDQLDPVPGITIYGITGAPIYSAFRDASWKHEGDNAAITSITQSGGIATVTTTSPHGLTTGDRVIIIDTAADQGYEDITDYNRSGTITVTSTTEFTYTVDSGLGSPAPSTYIWAYDFLKDRSTQELPPFWRRFSHHPSVNTAQNEFTTQESLSSMPFSSGYFANNKKIRKYKPRDPKYVHGQWLLA